MSAETLLAEAEWAMSAFEESARFTAAEDKMRQLAWLHYNAIADSSYPQRRVHELYAARPFARLELIYEEVFENILGQRVSEAGPHLQAASAQLAKARFTKRPILFVLHDDHGWLAPITSVKTRQLLNQYIVIEVPLKEGAALSQLTGKPPFEVSGKSRPYFVVTDSECEQLDSISGWNEPQFAAALEVGLAQ